MRAPPLGNSRAPRRNREITDLRLGHGCELRWEAALSSSFLCLRARARPRCWRPRSRELLKVLSRMPRTRAVACGLRGCGLCGEGTRAHGCVMMVMTRSVCEERRWLGRARRRQEEADAAAPVIARPPRVPPVSSPPASSLSLSLVQKETLAYKTQIRSSPRPS